MNQVHIHLMLNHFPIIGCIIGFLVVLFAYSLKNDVVMKTALGIFMFSAIMCIPVYITGDGAEDAVKNLPGVAAGYIDRHEDLGTIAMILIQVLGISSLATFYFMMKNHRLSRLFSAMNLGLSVVVIVIMVIVGNLGGKIRHSEIRSDQVNSAVPAVSGQAVKTTPVVNTETKK